MDEIAKLRERLDHLDEEILLLLNKRFDISRKIGKAKEELNLKVLDSKREKQIIQRLSNLPGNKIDSKIIETIFKDIFHASISFQTKLKIAYLGPEATYTHIAAVEHFGNFVEFSPQSSIDDVFLEVEKKRVDYGVVPVENSIEGAVNHTLDLLFESNLKICNERFLKISHSLLSKTGNLIDIKLVRSHPQAIAQCRDWLKKNLPVCDIEEAVSTAEAAKSASADETIGTIASSRAADLYNLRVVSKNIEKNLNNITRFLIIGFDKNKMSSSDKTSIAFVVKHKPGALVEALKAISDANLNMVKLESRPSKNQMWHYFFVMDIEGHIQDEKIKSAIAKMQESCLYLKCLGSYPAQNAWLTE